jgi:hypothetical protein
MQPQDVSTLMKARAVRRKRKAPGLFNRFRATLHAKINEGESGALLRAIERTLTSMPFSRESFDAINETLKRERKKYAAHSVRKPRKAGGSSTKLVQKGYELYQRYVDAGDAPDWEAIAYDCLETPCEDKPKATWKQRKEGFRKAVNKHRYRLKNEARRREK